MLKRVSYIISAIIHPGVMSILSFIIIAAIARDNVIQGVFDGVILLAGVAPAWIWHFRALNRQNTLDYYQVKGYHNVVIPLMFIGLFVVFIVLFAINAPVLVIQSLVAILVTTITCLIINRFWKISQHAAITMICAALFIPISGTIVLVMMFLSTLTGLSRIQLQVHTPIQVVAGWLYGFGVAGALVILMQWM